MGSGQVELSHRERATQLIARACESTSGSPVRRAAATVFFDDHDLLGGAPDGAERWGLAASSPGR
jgi:hypothetical protein